MRLSGWPIKGLRRRTLYAFAMLLAALGLSVALGGMTAHPQQNDGGPAPVALPSGSLTQRVLDTLQEHLAQRPDDPAAYRDLGLAYLQRARETADPGYYSRAEGSLEKALGLDSQDPETLVGLGTLALARHRFQEALGWGEKARALAPRRAAVYGVVADALVELGRYEEGFDAVRQMVNLRPDLTSYSRVSYARELQGDLPGAIEAMRHAASAGAAAGEQGSWTRVQLGNLLLQTGAIAEAEREYRWALAADPSNMLALAGLGRTRLTAGDYPSAIPFYEQAVERLPQPELVLTLGELYEATGRSEEAATQFRTARALQTLIAANGGNVDLELAIFEAERGDPARAVELARGEVGRRGSIHAYDALAWSLYHAGDYPAAREAAQQALRLGTNDALMLFHAGMIDWRLGETESARAKLAQALAQNPGFSARHVPEARRLLADLEPAR